MRNIFMRKNTFMRNCLVKITLRLFYPLSVVMTMLPRLLKQFRRLLQIKRPSQMPLVCYYFLKSQNIHINGQQTVEKGCFIGHLLCNLKQVLKFHEKKSNNWPVVRFIHNGSEITTWMGFNFKTKRTKSKETFQPFDFNILLHFSVVRFIWFNNLVLYISKKYNEDFHSPKKMYEAYNYFYFSRT